MRFMVRASVRWVSWVLARTLAVFTLFLAPHGIANAPLVVMATGERVALVVGNSRYSMAPLANPGNDARDIARLLTSAGFDVELVLDADAATMNSLVGRLERRWRSDRVRSVVFFYAGHAVQLDWRNLLLSVDARVRKPEDVLKHSLDVGELLRGFAAVNQRREKQLVVVLDACRDNPFTVEARLPSRGLTQFDAPPNTLVAFSTSPGQVALDGVQGGNSFYTSMLLRELSVPFVPIEDALKRVRTGVLAATLGRQVPWESTSLEGDFVLFPSAEAGRADSVEEQVRRELAAWNATKREGSIVALAKFTKQFPNGNFSQLAQHRLNLLLVERRRQEEEALAAELAKARQRLQEELERQRAAAREAEALEAERVAAVAHAERLKAEEAERASRIAAETDPSAPSADHIAFVPFPASPGALAATPVDAAPAAAAPSATAAAPAPMPPAAPNTQGPPGTGELPPALAVVVPPAPAAVLPPAALPPALAATVPPALAAALSALTPLDLELLAAASALGVPALPAVVVQLAAATPPPPPLALPSTPQFNGSQPLGRRFVKGDQWTYNVLDRFTRRTTQMQLNVTAVDEANDRVVYNNGQFTSDLMGNATSTDMGALDSPRQFYPATLQVGSRWVSNFAELRRNGPSQWFQYRLRLAARETVRVPAGTFESYRIEATGFNTQEGTRIQRKIWVTPGVNANIALEVEVRARSGSVERFERWELARYRPAQGPIRQSAGDTPGAGTRATP